MVSKVAVTLCLMAVWFGAAVAEECFFNQYIDSRLDSIYSAVLVNITTQSACLRYLQEHQTTHKAVAFHIDSERCCTVLQDLDYDVTSESGWNVFEIREEGGMPTIAPPIEFKRTVGICDNTQNKIFLLKAPWTFSVYSYDYDLSTDIDSARNYNAESSCYLLVVANTTYDRLKLTFTVHSRPTIDNLEIMSPSYRNLFSGEKFSHQAVIPRSRLVLTWKSVAAFSSFGFVLKIEGTEDPISESASTTVGLCDAPQNIRVNGESQVFAVYSYDYDVSLITADKRDYVALQRCMKKITVIDTYPNLKLEYSMESNEGDILEVVVGKSEYSVILQGDNTGNLVVPNLELSLNWRAFSNTSTIERFGFWIRVTGTSDPITVTTATPPAPTSKVTDLMATIGACDSPNRVISLNGKRTFSIYSYDYDLYEDYSKAREYGELNGCILNARPTQNLPSLKLEVTHNSKAFDDRLEVRGTRGEKSVYVFTGMGYHTITYVIPRDTLTINWQSTASTRLIPLGFVMRITETSERPTDHMTHGICDTPANYPMKDVKVFSVYSYDFDVSQEPNRAREYNVNEKCYQVINVDKKWPFIRIEIEYDTFSNDDNIGIRVGLNEEFKENFGGKGSDDFYAPNGPVTLFWFAASGETKPLGFWIKITGLEEEPTPQPLPEPTAEPEATTEPETPVDPVGGDTFFEPESFLKHLFR